MNIAEKLKRLPASTINEKVAIVPIATTLATYVKQIYTKMWTAFVEDATRILCRGYYKTGVLQNWRHGNSLLRIHCRKNWVSKNIQSKKRPRRSCLEPEGEWIHKQFTKGSRFRTIAAKLTCCTSRTINNK